MASMDWRCDDLFAGSSRIPRRTTFFKHHHGMRSAFELRYSPQPLYLIQGDIYGLASAPRTWTLHVCRCLKQGAWVQQSLDKILFYLCKKVNGYHSEILLAVAVVYVDDFLVTFSDHYGQKELLGLFSWGSQTTLTTETPLGFKGKEIHVRFDHERQFMFWTSSWKCLSRLSGVDM